MTEIGVKTSPGEWLADPPTVQNVDEIVQFLEAQGTFQFPTLSSGLFSAAAAENPEFRLTGYQNVWLRDNIHVAHALWKLGDKAVGVRAVQAFVDFYTRYRHRFVDIIKGRAKASDAQQRPHIRFDGESLTENKEHWAHAQNDALGYLLWFLCKLLRSGDLEANDDIRTLLKLLVQYFHKIEYWHEEDSGHWEETKKIEASSIGPVVAGLIELKKWITDSRETFFQDDAALLNVALNEGKLALNEILPAECIQPAPQKHRLHDSALLFLSMPLDILDDEMTSQIVDNVCTYLMEPIGIVRYRGDSYWCANYRDLLSAEKRTTDYSEDLSSRDALLVEGQEAQWCLFDPVISIIYGKKYSVSKHPEDLSRQMEHLRRSLNHLTTAESRFPAYRCPESYFLEHGEWIPNDICPLLWTQANLRLALEQMKTSAASLES